MIKLPLRKRRDEDSLTLLVAPPVPARAPAAAPPVASASASPGQSPLDLQPLDAATRQALVDALRAGSAGTFDRRLAERLPHVRWRTCEDVGADEYVTLSFAEAQVCILIDPTVADHFVYSRVADMAPLLNHIAERSNWSGDVGLNLGDGGRAGQISFCYPGGGVLIPDCYFLGGGGYAALRAHYSVRTDWDRRASTVLWRGATTGVSAPLWTDLQRAKLCRIAADAPSSLGFDVGFSHVVQKRSEMEEEEIRAAGLMRPWVDAADYASYKYHIDIDGNSNSWSGLFLKLLCGGLVFKVQSPHDYRQWFYPRLQPWLHYIPVDVALSNLTEAVAWAIGNQDRARRIATAGRRLAESLTLEAEADFAVSVVEHELWRSGRGRLG